MNMTQNHDDDGREQWSLTLDGADRPRIEKEYGLPGCTLPSSYMFHGSRDWDDGKPVLSGWYGGAPGLFEILQPIAEAERARILAKRQEESARWWVEANGFDLVRRP